MSDMREACVLASQVDRALTRLEKVAEPDLDVDRALRRINDELLERRERRAAR